MRFPAQLDRRTAFKWLACGVAAASSCGPLALADDILLHHPLPRWTEGHFDIHHIDTGRGNSTLLIFPDGTSMLIDAGAASADVAGTMPSAHPDAAKRPGEWQARYVLAHAPAKQLDYFLATHIHPDHISGLPDVQAALRIGVCIDRSFPDYAPHQAPVNAPFTQTYLDLLRERTAKGQRVERAKVGSTSQIAMQKQAARFPAFSAQVLAANGSVWNAASRTSEPHLSATLGNVAGTQGNENLFSVALRFRYGPFSYYTGGDLNADTHDGRAPELDIESPVARAAGRTEVAVANHHGYFDACGPAFTNTLDAQVYIIPAWDIGHPGSAQLQRMMGAWDNKATHDVFALDLLPANALINRRFASQLKSQQGHVIVRVAPGGKSYMLYVVDSTVENGNITGVFGPYTSRG